MPNKIINIVADESIWGVNNYFSQLKGDNNKNNKNDYFIKLYIIPASKITRTILLAHNTDVLLVRSSVKVDATMLEGTKVHFVATATVGDDHINKTWLAEQGISFASAAGSSTDSVVEYMLAALNWLNTSKYMQRQKTTLGIIGAGRIGAKVAKMAQKLAMDVLCNDPPRARQDSTARMVSLDYLLEHADIISLHTPLTHTGQDATKHLINAEKLAHFGDNGGYGLINAGRGALVDNNALLTWLSSGLDVKPKRFAILDCWENEPNPLLELLHHPACVLATPHIAGHSLDGKANNTQYIYNALCQYLAGVGGWESGSKLKDIMLAMQLQNIVQQKKQPYFHSLADIIRYLYDIKADDIRMRTAMPVNANIAQQVAAFRQLRKLYPIRRAWHVQSLNINDANLAKQATAIGISCSLVDC